MLHYYAAKQRVQQNSQTSSDAQASCLNHWASMDVNATAGPAKAELTSAQAAMERLIPQCRSHARKSAA